LILDPIILGVFKTLSEACKVVYFLTKT